MNTNDIMKLSLELAGLSKVPEDSQIYVGGNNIKKVLFAIDAGVPEILVAKQLRCDAVIAHHPAGGNAGIDFHEVFKRHIQQMIDLGIPEREAKNAVERKLEQLEVEDHTRNYGHAVDIAKLLRMPFMNIHTPLDEVGRKTMKKQIEDMIKRNSTLQDIVNALNKLPEFRNATTKIKIRMGKPDSPAGRVAVSHGAGTNGGYEVAKTYFKHGIGTVVYIHVIHADLEKLRTDGAGNLIVTGHVASDSVGINPFIRKLESKGVSVIPVGIISSKKR